MPKPMTILIKVEEIAMGFVFRKLKNMAGVISLDIDGDEDAPKEGAPRKSRAKGTMADGTSAKCLILTTLSNRQNQTATAAHLTEVLIAAGKSKSTFGSTSHVMKKKRLIVLTKAGWKMTVKGRAALETECEVG